jgi:hypothetical protein
MIMNFLRKRPLEKVEFDLVKKYGKLFGVKLFGKPTIFCTEPELISLFLSKEFTTFPNRRVCFYYDLVAVFLLNSQNIQNSFKLF